MHELKTVIFKNRNGLKLFGILEVPDKNREKDICIILLSPGVKTRVAPHRLYWKMSHLLCELGYSVFRFDFYGLGDSEGEIEEEFVADLYGSVAVGRYKEDTLDAIDWIDKNLGIKKIILSGLCGGAITGLLAGVSDDRVIGLFGLGVPVSLYGSNIDKTKYISQGQLKDLRGGYFSKIFDFKSWARLLMLKSDFRVIGKVLMQLINKPKKKVPPAESDNSDSDFNTLFVPAFFHMVSNSRHLLLIYSGGDRLGWEFKEKFSDPYQEKIKQHSGNYEIHNIEKANHILSAPEWQKEMMDYITVWLNRYY